MEGKVGLEQRTKEFALNDFIHKIGIVEKEASETCYWLELLQESQVGNPESVAWLKREAGELLAIFTSIGKKCKLTRPH